MIESIEAAKKSVEILEELEKEYDEDGQEMIINTLVGLFAYKYRKDINRLTNQMLTHIPSKTIGH